jgi:hypothetical protein
MANATYMTVLAGVLGLLLCAGLVLRLTTTRKRVVVCPEPPLSPFPL